jgi:hypothetical protein
MFSDRYLVPALFVCVGCHPSPQFGETYPVTGTVYQNGQPMKGGSIHFHSATDPLLRVQGEIKEDGTFALHTVRNNATGQGAPEGEYNVVVQPAPARGEGGGVNHSHKGLPPIAVPGIYKVEAKENLFKIELPNQ